jgi:hypothetical protein
MRSRLALYHGARAESGGGAFRLSALVRGRCTLATADRVARSVTPRLPKKEISDEMKI